MTLLSSTYQSDSAFTQVFDSDALIRATARKDSGNWAYFLQNIKSKTERIWLSSTTKLSCLSAIPASDEISFIIRKDDRDHLFVAKEGRLSQLKEAHRILNYKWVNSSSVLVIQSDKVDATWQLILYERDEKKEVLISSHVGHSIQLINDDEFSFVDIFSENYRYIKKHNISSHKSNIIIKIPNSTTYFSRFEEDAYLIFRDMKLLAYHPTLDVTWTLYYDFNTYPFSELGRIHAFENHKIIFTDEN